MGEKIAVIGGGAWGTALAALAARNGFEVDIYMRETDVATDINTKHENTVFLPDVELPSKVRAVDMEKLAETTIPNMIWAVPTQFSRGMARIYKQALTGKNILNASKGIEIETGKLVIQALQEEVDATYSLISGPSFAKEVALGQPTAVSLGSEKEDVAKWWQKTLSGDTFRIYTSKDMIGLEVGGALKNVIAVATGIADGMKYDHNTRAGLITRGLAEITRFGVKAYGAKRETFMGLAGLGDLVLTATGDSSRNRQMGKRIAEGFTVDEVSKALKTVSEGVTTAKAVYIVAKEKNIDMPICTEVYRIIYEGKNPKDSAVDLMHRPLGSEDDI